MSKIKISPKIQSLLKELLENTCREGRTLQLDGRDTCSCCENLAISMWLAILQGYSENQHQQLLEKKEGNLKCYMNDSKHWHCLFEGKDVGCLHTSRDQATKHIFGKIGQITECSEYCTQNKGYIESFIKNVTLKHEVKDKPKMDSGIIFSNNVVSYSELRAYASCKRKWDLGYTQGLIARKTKPSPALSKGTLFHRCLEEYYKQDIKTSEVILKIFDDKILEFMDTIGHKYKKNCDKNFRPKNQACKICRGLDFVYTMLKRYHEDASKWDENKLLVKNGLEYRFEENGFPIFGEPWPLNWKIKGFIDMIQRDKRTGVVELVDHKTTSFTFDYWRRNTLLELKWQALLYLLVMKQKLPTFSFDIVWRVSRTKGTEGLLSWEYATSFSNTEIENARKIFANRAYEMAISMGDSNLIYPNPEHSKCNMCEFNLICDKMNSKMDSPKFHKEMKFLYMERERH